MDEESSDVVSNSSNSKTIFDVFPFMESFPFDEYHFELEELGNSAERLGINPIIIEAAGSIVEPSLVNFTKHGEIVNISLSFYTYDIEYIYDKAETVKKMDDLSLILNNAVKCKNFKDKLIAIKEGKKFLKKIGSSSAVNGNFNKIFDNLLELMNFSLSSKEDKLIKKLNINIEQDDFNPDIQEIILEYYNLYLHHIRILLGIVIAAKIH